MSTPFPLEEQGADERLNGPMSDPWHGPAKPGFFSGLSLETPFEAMGSGAAKAEQAAADLLHQGDAVDPMNMGRFGLSPADVEMAEREKLSVNQLSDAITADAKDRVQAMTPDAATTGTAVRLVHGVVEGAYLATVGSLAGGLPGAAALTAGAEGAGTYHEQVEAGVSPTAAAESAGVTAVASAAGVVIPGGFGAKLLTKMATGAGAQVGLGLASRYADHKILEANGYPEMAAQQKVWDSTQMLTDTLLGFAFGSLAHLHGHEATAIQAAAKEPGMVDAALATNLAVQDRNLAPGVPVDPAATHAHQDALELSNQQLLEGKPVDVSETGVNEAKFAQRPVDEAHQAEAQAIAREYVPEQAYLAKGEYEALASLDDREIKDVPATEAQPSRWDVNGRPLWELSPEEMESASEVMRGNDVDKLTDIFGDKDLAAKYERLAASNSDRAYDASQKIHDAATPEQQAQLDKWEMGDGRGVRGALTPADVRDYASVMGRVDDESPETLAESLRYALTKVGDKTDPHEMTSKEMEGYLQLKHGLEIARANGWDTAAISERAIKAAAGRFADKNDAAYMLRRFLKEDERNAAYRPSEAEMTEAKIALIARAVEVAPERIEALASEHTGDSNAFIEAARQVIDDHAATAQRGESGARAQGAGGEPSVGAERSGGGRGAREGTAAAAGAGEPAGSRAAATERSATPLADTVQAALRDRPDLKVVADDGESVRAADLLRQVQEDGANEIDEFHKAVNAATNCYARRGA